MKTLDKIDRRAFLQKIGLGAAAVATASALGCVGRKSVKSENISDREIPTDKMTYRENPNSGDKVSLLGYGCMRLPNIMGQSSREYKQGDIDQDEVDRLTAYAVEHGVNYFDTSPRYCQGRSEHAMGIALEKIPRDKYFIATKLSNFDPESRTLTGAKKMYYNSFKELRVKVIDYYLLHNLGGGNHPVEDYKERFIDNGMIDFLMKERKAGRIRNLGLSVHCDDRFFDFIMEEHEKYHWDFVQIQMNYMDWDHARDTSHRNSNASYMYAELDKRGIPVVVMEPLLGGRLAKIHDYLAPRMLSRCPDRSIASWAFRFAGSFPRVLTVLSGMTYLEHLQDNIVTYSPLEELNEEEKAFLEEIAAEMLKHTTIPCTDCKYCMPCPYGLDIPSIFAHFNKCINEDIMPSSKDSSTYERNRKAFLVGYDRSVPKLRQADYCIGCGECVSKCPQRIKIPKQLKKIRDFVEALKQRKDFDIES